MSKKMIAIMKKEFARFFGDKRLVFTTILMPGLMIYILYTLLGQGIMKQFAASEDYVYQIYTVDLPEAFSYLKTESDLEVTEITVEKESDVLEKIEAEEADLLMVFQSDFDAAVAAYDPLDTTQAAPDINMYYNSVSTESSTIYNQMYQVFDDYESSLANKFDINAEEGVKYDVATEKDTSAQFFHASADAFDVIFIQWMYGGCTGIHRRGKGARNDRNAACHTDETQRACRRKSLKSECHRTFGRSFQLYRHDAGTSESDGRCGA